MKEINAIICMYLWLEMLFIILLQIVYNWVFASLAQVIQ